MERKLTLGEWLVEMERVEAFQGMSVIKNGELILRPNTHVLKAWAKAIKTFLGKHDVGVVIE